MKVAMGLFMAAVMIIGAIGVSNSFVPPRRCICPDNYDPVTCSNGQTYGNGCLASCAGATGCVRSGQI